MEGGGKGGRDTTGTSHMYVVLLTHYPRVWTRFLVAVQACETHMVPTIDWSS